MRREEVRPKKPRDSRAMSRDGAKIKQTQTTKSTTARNPGERGRKTIEMTKKNTHSSGSILVSSQRV